jgi:hypothetical protein
MTEPSFYEYRTREEWDKHWSQSAEMPPWRLARPWERVFMVLMWPLGAAIVVAGFILVMWLISSMADNYGQRQADYERCLKRATNGYEIQQCR